MKMRRKFSVLFILVMSLMLIVSGCGQNQQGAEQAPN